MSRHGASWQVITLAIVLALLFPAGAGAVTEEVVVADFSFTPRAARILAGDTVHWSRARSALERHNVRQRQELFVSGPASDAPDWQYSRIFSAGKFPYNCTLHPVQMVATVRVKPRKESAPDGRPFTVHWASSETNTGNVWDVQYRVDGGTWRSWKTDTARFRAVFGRDGRPVRVRDGHRYDFRVRSQKNATTPLQRSGWSPILMERP